MENALLRPRRLIGFSFSGEAMAAREPASTRRGNQLCKHGLENPCHRGRSTSRAMLEAPGKQRAMAAVSNWGGVGFQRLG